jgi:hypothetical protein
LFVFFHLEFLKHESSRSPAAKLGRVFPGFFCLKCESSINIPVERFRLLSAARFKTEIGK